MKYIGGGGGVLKLGGGVLKCIGVGGGVLKYIGGKSTGDSLDRTRADFSSATITLCKVTPG